MTYRSDFASRHIGPNQYQIQTMLLELGYKDLDTFIKAVVPENIHIKGEIEKILPSQNLQQQLESTNEQLAQSLIQIEALQAQIEEMSKSKQSPEMIQANAFAHDVNVKQQAVEKDMLKIFSEISNKVT